MKSLVVWIKEKFVRFEKKVWVMW